MRFMNEYRDGAYAERYRKAIAKVQTKPWTLMEVCGGQTHAILKYGIDQLLPPGITLVHGPGCPVCVTAVELIDKAIEIAVRPGVTLCSFGDMIRVPGSHNDLQAAKAAGGDVRIVYSPLDALRLAQEDPKKQVVFFGVGFETTAPANATAIIQAKQRNINNFSMLVAHVRVPPAMEAILSSPGNVVQGFLAPGHVCAVMGCAEYEDIARKYKVPMAVTGFEPLDILQGIHICITQLEQGRTDVAIQYARGVLREGNIAAQRLMQEVFTVIPRKWRGIGEIPESGLALSERYADFDAELLFGLVDYSVEESTECISGLVLQGNKKPVECPAFGTRCTPETPLGATMVSSEGACAAYYRYRNVS